MRSMQSLPISCIVVYLRCMQARVMWLLLQGASCSLAVSARAYAGAPPPMLDFPEHIEAPSTSAAKHASRFATNLHPVSTGSP